MLNLVRVIALLFVYILGISFVNGYDQTFPSVKLRYGYQYNFYDVFNNGSKYIYLNNYSATFTEKGNYNGGSDPSFVPTSELIAHGLSFNPYESIKAVESNKSYNIGFYPISRSTNNIEIVYTAKYYVWNTATNSWSAETSHTEYQPYEITWCGDGVVDDYRDAYTGVQIFEQCDDGNLDDNDGCSSTCRIETPEAECVNLSATPDNGDYPLVSTLTCAGTNASTYKIEVRNDSGTLLSTINGANGSYTFNSEGTYNARCFVDGDITNNSCSTTIDVTEPPFCGDGIKDTSEQCDDGNMINGDGCSSTCIIETPEPVCNTLSISNTSGLAPLTSSFSCSGDDVTSYKIEIRDSSGSLVRRIDSRTGTYTFNTAGVFDVKCYVDGTITSNSCSGTVTTTQAPFCGDGNVDTGETCDDGNNINGDGCSSTCTIEQNPTCNSLSITPRTGNSPLNSSFNCNGSNTSTYKIEIRNDIGTLLRTINSSSGNYTFSTPGNYSARCYVDGTVTSNSCVGSITASQAPFCGDGNVDTGETCDDGNNINGDGCSATCSVETPDPVCSNLSITPSAGNSPLLSSFTCTGANTSNYRIEIRNNAGSLLRTINSNTGNYSFSSSGTYSARCFVEGTVTSNACAGNINVTTTPPMCISGGVTGVQSSPVTQTTTGLCGVGETVGNFTSNTTGNTTNYSWSCNGVSGGTCSASYTAPAVCVNGGVNGNLSSPITQTSTGLCRSGETVGNFISNTVGTQTSYSWSCNGLTGSSCTAVYSAPICISGGITGTQTVPVNQNTPNLCRAGDPVGNFASITTGNTTNYTWTCGGISGGNCNANYTQSSSTCVNGGVSGSQSRVVTESTSGLCRSGETVGNFLESSSGNTTNYTWTCNGLSGPSCSASYTSGGGGSTPTCLDILVSGDDVTCIGNTKTNSLKVDCGNGIQLIDRATTNSLGQRSFTFNCDYSTTPRSYTPKCYVSGSSTVTSLTNSGWGTRLACSFTDDSPYCGNGILEPGEKCERTFNTDGSLGSFPSFCNSNCSFGGGGSNPGTNGIMTIPNHGDILFGPTDNVIIGHGDNPYIEVGERPYIVNDSDYDLRFDKLCVDYTSGSSINYSLKTHCKTLPSILYPGQRVELDNYPDYTGNKDAIASNQSYGLNKFVVTVEDGGTLYDSAYFAANLNVRVSKPSIVTTGGGTSFISNTSKIANVESVATSSQNKNKNFAGTSISNNNTSSFADNTTDSEIVLEVTDEGDEYKQDVTDVVDETGTSAGETNSLSDFEEYNGISNVLILKNKNFRISSDIFSSLNGPRTYIVENGNLLIDRNIVYPENIAFVVKGGDIKLHEDVTRIDGTYITIPKSGNGGKIISSSSSNILKVNGSLYGNITELVDNRYKVEERSDGQLSVGTIVSFGSAIFRKPAPLVSQFITEYLNVEKVAK